MKLLRAIILPAISLGLIVCGVWSWLSWQAAMTVLGSLLWLDLLIWSLRK